MFNDTDPRYPRPTVLHCGIPSFIRRIPTRDPASSRRRRAGSGFVFLSIFYLGSRYKNDNKTTSYRFRAILKLPSYVVLRNASLFVDSFPTEIQASPVTRISSNACMPPSSIFSSVLRQKPERRKPLAAPLPNGRIISRNQVKLSTVSSTLRTAPLRFPFPRFSTSNLVSSFVSTLVSHLRFSLSLPLRLLYSPPLQMTPFFQTRAWKRSRERICARKSSE